MATPIVSRPGQANATGDPSALFLKVFAGEVMKTFQLETIFDALQRIRSISAGKSAQFPAIGQASAGYMTPGDELVGQSIAGNERVINIDQLLVASCFIANIDEAMSHFDFRGPYATELGRALAREYDANLARVVARAARSQATITGGNGGASGGVGTSQHGTTSSLTGGVDTAALNSNLRNTAALTTAAALTNLIWKAVEVLDTKNVPKNDRYVAVRPAQFYLLLNNPSGGASQNPVPVINRDYGGEGSIVTASIPVIAGCAVKVSNNIPSASVVKSATTTGGNDYSLDVDGAGSTNLHAGLVWQKEAIGTVKLLDMATEMEYSVAKQGTLMAAKYACGHGVLRPECACELTAWDGSAS